jgi:hypothetical protein
MLGGCDRTYPAQDGASIRVRQVQDSSIEPLYIGILRVDDTPCLQILSKVATFLAPFFSQSAHDSSP